MLSFEPNDFIELSDFALAWRWCDPHRATELPAEARRRIRPLTSTAAARVGDRASFLCDRRRDGMRRIPADGEADRVRQMLATLPIDEHARVVVSWSDDVAVVTDWPTFRAYWDEFCYPSSDDVTIWPLDERWSLCYDHYAEFRFSDHDHAI